MLDEHVDNNGFGFVNEFIVGRLIQYKDVAYQCMNPLLKIKRSYDSLIATMGFTIAVRGCLYSVRAQDKVSCAIVMSL